VIVPSSGNAIRDFGVFTQSLAAALDEHQDLRLTRLACGKSEMPSPSECARMGGALPEPPGSFPYTIRDRCPQGCSPAPHLRCAAHLPWRAAPAQCQGVQVVAKLTCPSRTSSRPSTCGTGQVCPSGGQGGRWAAFGRRMQGKDDDQAAG
jgi:hypothetical protein